MESRVINKQQHFRSQKMLDCLKPSILSYFYLNVEPVRESREYWTPVQNGKLDAVNSLGKFLHEDQIHKKIEL